MPPEWNRVDGGYQSEPTIRRRRSGERRHRAAAPAGRSGRLLPRPARSGLRVPLLLRSAIAIGVIAALAASVARADPHGRPDRVRFTIGPAASSSDPNQTAAAAQSLRERGSTSASRSRASASPADPAGNATAAPTPTGTGAAATAPCHISYSVVPQTGDQFAVVMVIANTSSSTLNGWTLRWQFPPGQKIVYGWNAMVTNGAGGAVATNTGLDQTLAPGASTTIGFVGKRQGWIPTPTGFTLNGQLCQWEPTTATPTAVVPTSSSPSSTSSPSTTTGMPTNSPSSTG